MTSLGFENYAEALKIYLTKYREVSQATFGADGHMQHMALFLSRTELLG